MIDDPKAVGGSVSKRRRMRSANRTAQGYERKPARCINCAHFKPSREATGKHPYVQAMCGLGHFPVASGAICNLWVGKNGETLE